MDRTTQVTEPPHTPIRAAAALAVVAMMATAGAVRAEHHSVVAAGAQQCTNDTNVQLVGMLMESAGEHLWSNCIEFAFFAPGGAPTGAFVVDSSQPDQDDPPSAPVVANVGSQQLADTPGAPTVHIVIPAAVAAGIVPGGTVCYRSSGNATHSGGADDCRDGINVCQTITPVTCGCDGLPGSGAVVDACGVCGGDGSSCASGVCGDVSGDATVNLTDALLIAQFDVGLRACGLVPAIDACDIAPTPASPDGNCNITDALLIAQCDVGLRPCDFGCDTFTCPVP